MVIDKIGYKLCCGCTSCKEICPKDALQMVYNNEGFRYPELNKDNCINCGLCDKVCPILNANTLKYQQSQQVYAAVNKDDDILKESSSGGIFSSIASYILNNGGYVCGAAFDDNLYLHHILINSKEELYRLRGSKYLASENEGIYAKIRNLLNDGKLVYYTGTGCQVAGLRAFLRKEYENLITSDLVCHGTPSQKMFRAFVTEIEKRHKVKLYKYAFRDKNVNGWSCCSSSSSSMDLATGRNVYIDFDRIQNAYFTAFITGCMNREGCYECPFTETHRCGDITLADYWGVKKFHKEIKAFKGVSAIIVNTDKGRDMLNKISDNIELTPSKMEWVALVNANLVKKTSRPERRNTIYYELDNDSYKMIKSFFSKSHYFKYCKFIIKKHIRKNEWLFGLLYNFKHKLID